MGLLANKIALVTGGSRGIGKAIARLFLKHGASVGIFGTHVQRGNDVVREFSSLCQAAQSVHFFEVDVSKEEKVKEGIDQFCTTLGAPDILVNNAGITRDGLLLKMKTEDWEDVLRTNLSSVFYITQGIIRSMIKRKAGTIINITSIVGLTGQAGQTNYAASKAGIIGFTKSLAREVASRGIRVNAIAPGFIETDMTGTLSDEQKKSFMEKIPLGRIGTPEDIAHVALFLASDLSGYMTGQTCTVDGGIVMM